MKALKKLYDTKENLFAILWIVVYCAISIPIRGELGDESVWIVIAIVYCVHLSKLKTAPNHLLS